MREPKPKYRFSIVIPCYNEADFISNTLISLKNQETTAKYEVIVVDNNSDDETAEIAKKYGARVIAEVQPGVCAARQAGTLAAEGEIIISTDADTIFSPTWLKTIDNDFNKNKQLVAVGGPCRYFDGPWWGKVYTHFLFGSSYAYSLIIGHPFYMTATNIAFKKSAWHGYDLTMMQGGDEVDLLHRLRQRGKVGFNNSNPTYTSGRRLSKGLAYNLFVTFLFYYLGAYYIDRIMGRNIIGSAPAFRKTNPGKAYPKLAVWLSLWSISVFTVIVSIAPIRGLVSDNIEDTASLVKDTVKIIT
jgi:glycosyltransferase involved in cell wall biosynthesis